MPVHLSVLTEYNRTHTSGLCVEPNMLGLFNNPQKLLFMTQAMGDTCYFFWVVKSIHDYF